MSESIVGKIDTMNGRIVDLERSLDGLINQAAAVGAKELGEDPSSTKP